MGYHYPLDENYCCTLAPSVADEWQGRGIGTILFDFVQAQLQAAGIRQLILWGGVQSTNLPAQGFYRKKGFIRLGSFEYHGRNDDMLLEMGREC